MPKYEVPQELRLKCLDEVHNGDSVAEVAVRNNVKPSTLSQWKRDVARKRTVEFRREERKEFEERMRGK